MSHCPPPRTGSGRALVSCALPARPARAAVFPAMLCGIEFAEEALLNE